MININAAKTQNRGNTVTLNPCAMEDRFAESRDCVIDRGTTLNVCNHCLCRASCYFRISGNQKARNALGPNPNSSCKDYGKK